MESELVSKHISPPYAVAAFFVSYIGAWTALELLCRRTASRGFYNWFILIGSSLAMGGIAIWGMYFIGNRATVIGNGAEELQPAYSPGFTTLSFFVPILVLLVAFAVVGTSDERLDYFRIILAGTLTGSGVCAMHYLGQAGISNYECLYTLSNFIGAAVIAIVASIAALGFFAYFRSSWDTRWWSRIISAVILATAVSGTHWVTSVGTAYHPKGSELNQDNTLSRNNNCIGVMVLSVSACVILLLITVLGQRRLSIMKNRNQQIAVAAVIFDEEGKILVSPEGHLPHRRITDTYIERTMDDVFCISHPLFLWIFRTTFCWSSVSSIIPAIRAYLDQIGVKNRHGSHDSKMISDDGKQVGNYDLIFKGLFCTAVAELADDFHIPVNEMGVLFDDILTIGRSSIETDAERAKLLDLELQGIVSENSGSGQLLFLTKSVDIKEAYHLQAAGYRFAASKKVIKSLAKSVQSNENVMLQWLRSMRSYGLTEHTLERGVHLACFTIRASMVPGRGGFEVLVRKDATNLLPTMKLPFDRLEPWQQQYLNKFDRSTVAVVLKLLRKASMPSNPLQAERIFAKQLFTRLEALRDEIEDPFFYDACLIGTPIEVPCRGHDIDSLPGIATIIAFQIIVPLQSRAPGEKASFVPVNFFKMQQLVQKNSPDHTEFSQHTYQDFAPMLNLDAVASTHLVLPETPKISPNISSPVRTIGSRERRTYVDTLFELCIARK